MGSVKGGDYVLTVSVLKRRDENGVPRRYKRGDTVTLTAEQAARQLACGAVAKPGGGDAKAAEERPGSELASSPTLPEQPDPASASSLGAALANSGLGQVDATGGVLTDEQLNPAPPVTGDGVPPKAATVDTWREWAVKTGKLTEAEAADKSKPELQALAK